MTSLCAEAEIKVRFSEVDMLTIVWHGHYVQYLEEGRQAFGEKFGLGYMDVYRHGYSIPIVKLNIDYKQALKFQERAVIETAFVNTEAAKLVFRYAIKNKESGRLIATAETVQVFVDKEGQLSLTNPVFFVEWKEKWLDSSGREGS